MCRNYYILLIAFSITFHVEATVKHVIFDIGGVILSDGPKYSVQDPQRAHLNQAFKTDAWKQWMRGSLTQAQLIDQLSQSFNREEIIWLLDETLNPHRPLIEECVSLVKKLKKKGYKVYVLSNFAQEAHQTFILGNDFFNHFDGMMFSFQVGVIKPEAMMFNLLLKKYELDPYECAFIDDIKANVDAAQELGIIGIEYRNGYLESELNSIGIDLSSM